MLDRVNHLRNLHDRKVEVDRESFLFRYPTPGVFAQAMVPRTKQTPALEAIDNALLGWTSAPEDRGRLMVFCPPQEGKSTKISGWTPLWRLAADPTLRIAIVSYAANKAERWGRWLRRMIEGHPELGIRLMPDSRAAERFETTAGGRVICVGMEGGITGEPVDDLYIDDPLRGRAEAESATYRERAWEWWESNGATRLSSRGRVVLMLCIVAGERVLTGDGRWVPVEEIRPGDAVVSLDESRTNLVTAKVTAQRYSGDDTTVRVLTDRLSLRVNGRHPFAALRRDRFRPNADEVEWVRAEDLAVGDLVVTAKSLPADHVGADVLPDATVVDEKRAWLLGYMLGDGWVTAHRRANQQGNPTSYAICVAIGKSPRPEKADLNERVRDALEAWSPNRVYSSGHGYLRSDWAAGGRLLTHMGYGKGTRGKRVPDCVWGWAVSLRRAFLLGYAEADGSLQYTNTRTGTQTWQTVSVNEPLLRDIRDLALTCGVRPTTVTTGGPGIYQPPNSPAPVVSTPYRLSLAFAPFQAEGKSNLGKRGHPAPEAIRYERVRAIETGPVMPVYDLTVEGTESFIAEGFAVHNTRWHADDLAGRLGKEEPGEWTVLRIPAIRHPELPVVRGNDGASVYSPSGELISVQNRRPDYFHELKTKRSGYVWRSVYDQDPVAAEGNLFSRPDFRYWTPLPPNRERRDRVGGARLLLPDSNITVYLDDCWRFLTVDLAGKKTTAADFTVAAVWALTGDGQLILLDRIRQRLEEGNHWTAIKPLTAKWAAEDVFVERGFIGTTMVIEATRAGMRIEPLDPDADKITRAIPATHRVAAHLAWFPAQATWLDEWCDELAGFPSWAHDDQVDTFAYAVRVSAAKWNPYSPHTTPSRNAPQGVDPITDAYAAMTGTPDVLGGLDPLGDLWR